MKPIILTFTSHYLPGYRAGGPIRTIANMVERLSDTFEFRIVALDRDIGDAHPYPDLRTDVWTPCGKASVLYVSRNGFGLNRVAEIVRSTPHDAIYLNSFFDPRFTQQVLVNRRLGRLCGRPIVVAPRGEFSAGALRIKWWKKCVFIGLAKRFKMYDGLTWQASSSLETEDIQSVMSIRERRSGRVVVCGKVAVAADIADSWNNADALPGEGLARQIGGPLRACFLSRISPMKNLDFALRVLAEVHAPVRFAIYGPIEDAAYWARCKALIAKLPSHIEVAYEGKLEYAQVGPTLAQHDLFLLPTRGENFGHVIYEALRAGLPLLISDQTPWQRLTDQGVGWDLPLDDISAFARRIEEVAGWPLAEYQQWVARAHALAVQVGDNQDTLEANRRLFLDAIDSAVTSESMATAKGAGSV